MGLSVEDDLTKQATSIFSCKDRKPDHPEVFLMVYQLLEKVTQNTLVCT